jgi:hypothetical protein
MIGRAAADLSKLSTNAQEIQLRKAEFGRAAADHLSEIAKKTEETRRLQKPSVKMDGVCRCVLRHCELAVAGTQL